MIAPLDAVVAVAGALGVAAGAYALWQLARSLAAGGPSDAVADALFGAVAVAAVALGGGVLLRVQGGGPTPGVEAGALAAVLGALAVLADRHRERSPSA